MSSVISPHLSKIFAGVHPSFLKLITKGYLSKQFKSCIANLNSDLLGRGVKDADVAKNTLSAYIRPNYTDILEAFRNFDINNTRVIIIGRDPYAEINLTTGMAFSCNEGFKSPVFDKGIYEALKHSEYISHLPEHGNLTNYTHQGVLLLNKYLTRTPEIVKDSKGVYVNGNGADNNKNLHKFWKDFTVSLLNYITSSNLYTNHKIPVLLWGVDAHKLERFVGPNGVVLKWGHPSPKNSKADNPENFKYCDHFIKVNEILKSQGLESINWDPDFIPDRKLTNQFYTAKLMGINVTELSIKLVDEKRIYDDRSNSEENTFILNYISGKKTAPTQPEPVEIKETAEIKETNETAETKETKETKETEEPVQQESVDDINDSIVVFTDGACKGGSANPKGSIGVYFPAAFNYISNGFITGEEELMNTYIKGPLPENTLKFDKSRKIVETDVTAKPTNQRAELFAAVTAFEKIIDKLKKTDAEIKKPIMLVTDSEYVIKWITYLLWNTMNKNPKLTDVPNRDLIVLLYHGLSAIYKIYSGSDKGTPDEKRLALIGSDASKKWQAYASNPKSAKPPVYDPNWKGISIVHVTAHSKVGVLPRVSYGEVEESLLEEFKHGNAEADRLTNEGINTASIVELTTPYE